VLAERSCLCTISSVEQIGFESNRRSFETLFSCSVLVNSARSNRSRRFGTQDGIEYRYMPQMRCQHDLAKPYALAHRNRRSHSPTGLAQALSYVQFVEIYGDRCDILHGSGSPASHRREDSHHHLRQARRHNLKRMHRYGTLDLGTSRVDRSCYCFVALDRPDRLEIALFGNRGTAWTPAQSVAIVCSTTRVWSDKSGTTPWMTMSVARPKIENHQV
jgi:hypothetical protein